MILDIILITLFILMMLYGYKKGCIGIVAKLISLLVAFVLAYILAEVAGNYIIGTSLGETIETSIKNTVLGEIKNEDQSTVISIVQEKLNIEAEETIVEKIIDYVFTGIGFVVVFVATRIVLWIAQKIVESIFDLPVLKTFNKLGGVIASVALFLIEISILLAVVKSVSTLTFMNSVVNFIESSVITKALYDHNIITNLILSRII